MFFRSMLQQFLLDCRAVSIACAFDSTNKGKRKMNKGYAGAMETRTDLAAAIRDNYQISIPVFARQNISTANESSSFEFLLKVALRVVFQSRSTIGIDELDSSIDRNAELIALTQSDDGKFFSSIFFFARLVDQRSVFSVCCESIGAIPDAVAEFLSIDDNAL